MSTSPPARFERTWFAKLRGKAAKDRGPGSAALIPVWAALLSDRGSHRRSRKSASRFDILVFYDKAARDLSRKLMDAKSEITAAPIMQKAGDKSSFVCWIVNTATIGAVPPKIESDAL